MKKALCLILALLALLSLGAACAETETADSLASLLSETCDVQAGHFEYMDTIALASRGKLISCFGNNADSGYLVSMIPSALYDASAEKAPANPYFSPVGWTYKLRQDEAVVLVGTLPPECKYFSLINYVFSSAVKPGKTYGERSFFQYGSAEAGAHHPVFASMPMNWRLRGTSHSIHSCEKR